MINLLEVAKKHWFNYKEIYPFIVILGAGGTGSYTVQNLAQLIGSTKTKGSIVIADPDVIEEKNLGNQLFLKEEVGLRKADVLASRYSAAYQINIGSFSESFIEDETTLKKLFSTEYLDVKVNNSTTLVLPIIIGCVDNHFTRKIMHEFFKKNYCIYIDSGNEAPVMPNDWTERPKSEWTDSELETFRHSGWSGQVITGVNLNLYKQEAVGDVFPEILEDTDEIRPSELSCTELTASEPQRAIVNKYAAMIINSIVNEIIEDRTISTHKTVFHAKKKYIRSTENL